MTHLLRAALCVGFVASLGLGLMSARWPGVVFFVMAAVVATAAAFAEEL